MKPWAKNLQCLLRGKSIQAEARRLGIPYTTFHRMVNGTGDVSIDYLIAAADGYGISLDELIGRKNSDYQRSKGALEAIAWLQVNARNWFADTQVKDMSDADIITIKKFIEKRLMERKAEEDALRREKERDRGKS